MHCPEYFISKYKKIWRYDVFNKKGTNPAMWLAYATLWYSLGVDQILILLVTTVGAPLSTRKIFIDYNSIIYN